jgi:hypothetical protein
MESELLTNSSHLREKGHIGDEVAVDKIIRTHWWALAQGPDAPQEVLESFLYLKKGREGHLRDTSVKKAGLQSGLVYERMQAMSAHGC